MTSGVMIHAQSPQSMGLNQKPQLDPRDELAPATNLLNAGAPKLLSYGYIALQAEGQPVWFRNIELKSLEQP